MKNVMTSLSSIITSVSYFIRRYHFIIFFVIMVGGLSVAMFFLNKVIVSSDEPNGYTSKSDEADFDQATIDRLRALKESDQSTKKLEFTGRLSPF
jgi:hypothetical protein